VLALSRDMQDGRAFAYAVPAGADPQRYRFTLESALTLLQRAGAATLAALSRPPRSALMHMRALQALDGAAAGASQREIGVALFGRERVTAEWHPDSEVRAQVRYLLERGRGFMQGSYRDLLK
jgi:hypothetical protein